MLDAQAQVQHQVGAGPPVVLDEGAEVIHEYIGGLGDGGGAAGGNPEQEVGEGVAGAFVGGREVRSPGEILAEFEREAGAVVDGMESHAPPLAAEFQGVVSGEPRKGGADLARGPLRVGDAPGPVGPVVVAVILDHDQRELPPVAGLGVDPVHETGGDPGVAPQSARRIVAGELPVRVVEVSLPVAHRQHRSVVRDEGGVDRDGVDIADEVAGAGSEDRRVIGVLQVREVAEAAVRGGVVHVGARRLPRVGERMAQVPGEEERRDGLDPRSRVVASRTQRGEHPRQRRPGRINAVRRDHIPRERPPVPVRVEVERVVDRPAAPGEVAGGRRGARQGHDGVADQFVVIALARDEEEGPVAEDGAAEGSGAEAERRLDEVRVGEVAAVVVPLLEEREPPPEGVQPAGAELVEAAPRPLVRAVAVDHIEHPAAGAAHLGVVGVRLDLHLLHRLERRDDHRPVPEVGHRDPVHGVVVAAQRPPRRATAATNSSGPRV